MNENIEKIETIDAVAFSVETVNLAEVETIEEMAFLASS